MLATPFILKPVDPLSEAAEVLNRLVKAIGIATANIIYIKRLHGERELLKPFYQEPRSFSGSRDLPVFLFYPPRPISHYRSRSPPSFIHAI